MQRLLSLFLVVSIVAGAFSSVVPQESHSEPRIFFKQIIEGSGLFPVEINVPDTIGAMMNGISSMYQAAANYFGGSGNEGGSEGGEASQSQLSFNELSRPINGKLRRKKVKRAKKKTGAESDDEDDNIFDLLVSMF